MTRRPLFNCQNQVLSDLAEEFMKRHRAGLNPSVLQYATGYPELEHEIKMLFPTLPALDQLGKNLQNPARVEKRQTALLRYPKRLGDFKLKRVIGRGGMGVVFEAIQASLNRPVALKMLPNDKYADGDSLHRFQLEARTAAGLCHSRIVPVFGMGQHGGHHFYVMPLIKGVSLQKISLSIRNKFHLLRHVGGSANGQEIDLLRNRRRSIVASIMAEENVGSVSPDGFEALRESNDPTIFRNIAEIGAEIADALAYAHRRGTVHRDVKPSNIMVDNSGDIWVTDFGLAISLDKRLAGQNDSAVGTPRYMAPEQHAGCADGRSDLYSLGLTLFNLLTLQRPPDRFSNGSEVPGTVFSKGIHPRMWNPVIPRALDEIVAIATATNPNDRFQSAEEIAARLRAFADPPARECGEKTVQAKKYVGQRSTWFGSIVSAFH